MNVPQQQGDAAQRFRLQRLTGASDQLGQSPQPVELRKQVVLEIDRSQAFQVGLRAGGGEDEFTEVPGAFAFPHTGPFSLSPIEEANGGPWVSEGDVGLGRRIRLHFVTWRYFM